MVPMKSKSWCSPGQLLMLMLAGWINRHQQAVIAYQKEEIKVLREMLGGKRLRFTDEQRRRLALKTKALSACTLKDLGPLVTPDTLCRVSTASSRWVRRTCESSSASTSLITTQSARIRALRDCGTIQ